LQREQTGKIARCQDFGSFGSPRHEVSAHSAAGLRLQKMHDFTPPD
jgi:hypothetical protein